MTEDSTSEACRHKHAESVSSQGNEAVASARQFCAQGGYEVDVDSEVGAETISVGTEDVPASAMISLNERLMP